MAVYTKITNDELTEFLSGYDIDQVVSYKGIEEGVENSNYLLRTLNQSYVLTIYEKRVAETDLPFFLKLMNYLAKESVPCPTPIHIVAKPVEKLFCSITFINVIMSLAPEHPKG